MDFSSFIQTNLFTLHNSQVGYKMLLPLGVEMGIGVLIDIILWSFLTLEIKWRQLSNLIKRVSIPK